MSISHLIATCGYWAVFALVAAESLGIPLPGETALGFGADPMSPGFGAHIFATGDSGHSGYLNPGSASLRNLTYIALGDPATVTR